MFTTTMRFYFCLAILILPMVHNGLAGQDPGETRTGLFQESLASFEKGEFRLAYEGFTKMIQDRSGNAMCSYYAGRCLVEMNEKLDEAIELLYSASGKSVPGDVDLYLGMAYHRNYNFAEAIRYYSRFETQAARQDVKVSRVKQLISDCRSAREITASYNQYAVMNVTFIDLSDSAEFTQIRMKGGELRRKPPEYFSPGEDREGLSSLMFMPVNPVRGDYIYYSGHNRAGRDGTQLFRVRRSAGRTWGDPEEIRTLNTEGDEILPYFDPIESDLYYASDGSGGVGGFDLYRSHYDTDRDQWSEPINLGFPVNSVMDEYLLLPGSDLGMLMFFSTREGTDSTVTVYRVHLVEPKKKADPNNPGMLKEIASMGGVAEEILAELRSVSGPGGKGSLDASQGEVGRESNPPKREPAITKVTILSPATASGSGSAGGKAPYQEILAEALQHQAASDSLKDLAISARARVRESDDPNDRWVWQKQIMVWEKKSRDEEELADALYARMDQRKEPAGPGPAVNMPETIEVDTVIGDLTVYRYTNPYPGIEGEPGTQPEMKPPVTPAASGYMNRFDILGASPYSESNPIPVDVTLPGGVYYRVQLGAFADEVEPGAFQGISPVTAETVSDRGLIKYYAGKFTKYEDASAALARIRSKGYEDAFIVAWYNGAAISTQRAKQLE
jgi:tetratricopeptide (TPR) repeat protein